MDSEDKFLAKVSGIQSLSSSVQSTPERHSDDASQSPELVQEFVKSSRDLFQSHMDKGKKQAAPSKSKMIEQPLKTCMKNAKNQDPKKPPSSSKDQASSRKSHRKGENPIRIPSMDQSLVFGNSNAWICKNKACKAKLSMDDTFCKRCSCCICHLFDDNKDPSLWLVCSSESSGDDYCGLSCHIGCALKCKQVGVVDLGQLMQLDGSYCCFACGKVSCILGCWKKQLAIAKEARRVDNLCERIFLSFRILNGTSRFKELHKIVENAKAKLEPEVGGPLDGDSAKANRGIVSRLSVASEVQKLCSLAVEKADEWLAAVSNSNLIHSEGSLPAACKFYFEEVTCSSVVIVLIEMSSSSTDDIKGYKLWYCKSRDESHSKDPISVFPRTQRRILISNLQPCTEYSFRIRSYTETGDLGHSEAKCFTKSLEIIHKKLGSTSAGFENDNPQTEVNNNKDLGSSSGFKVRSLGKVLHLAWAQEQGCFEGLSGIDLEKCYECDDAIKPVEAIKYQSPPVSHQLDLNIASVPDLNEELFPPFESPRNENNGCLVEQAAVRDDNDLARSHGSGNSRDWTNGEVPAVNSSGETCRKRAASAIGDTLDCNSTLVNGSTFRISEGLGCLDENFEYCVKTIRWLECEGHIEQEFRLKFLTWFSLRSTEKERRIVNTFIQALIDDPVSLAAQLVDSFSDSVSNKRRKNGFCSELWHN